MSKQIDKYLKYKKININKMNQIKVVLVQNLFNQSTNKFEHMEAKFHGPKKI